MPALFQGLKILLAGLPIHLDKLSAFKPRHNNAPEQGRSSPLAKMSEQAVRCPFQAVACFGSSMQSSTWAYKFVPSHDTELQQMLSLYC